MVARLIFIFLTLADSCLCAHAATHYQRLWSFGAGNDGRQPTSQVVEGSDGALYGTTWYGGSYSNSGTVYTINKDGSGYRVLYSFGATASDGANPFGEVREASDGFLYGTTENGGSHGSIFRMKKDGSGYLKLRDSLVGPGDGGNPVGGLVEGPDGALYGLTLSDGAHGYGTAFMMNKDGSAFTNLHAFDESLSDSGRPAGSLHLGSDGFFYGIANYGYQLLHYGSVFRLSAGTFTNLHLFLNAEGHTPNAPLTEGSDGALYSTTGGGGALTFGTIFKLNLDGSGFQVIYNFDGTNGGGSEAGVVEGSDGYLYGTTDSGGANHGGVVFRVRKDGSDYSVLHSFSTNGFDGYLPRAPLLLGSNGAFYGTTYIGGDSGFGTIFVLWPPETPDVSAPTITNGTVAVTVAGSAGYQYQVLRSIDLTNWSVLNSFTMPVSEVYTNIDNSPPVSSAYYRAAWVR